MSFSAVFKEVLDLHVPSETPSLTVFNRDTKSVPAPDVLVADPGPVQSEFPLWASMNYHTVNKPELVITLSL